MRLIITALAVVLLASATTGAQAQDSAPQSVAVPPLDAPPRETAEAAPLTEADMARMVGQWEEYTPSRNFVDFGADGSVTLYLKPGEVGDLDAMRGTWSRGEDGELVLRFEVLGVPIVQQAGVAWDGEELLLVSQSGVASRHRRRTGPLPAEYQD